MLIRHHTDAISLPLREKAVQNYAFLSELTSICPIFLRPAAPTPALRRARTELGKTRTELGETKTELYGSGFPECATEPKPARAAEYFRRKRP